MDFTGATEMPFVVGAPITVAAVDKAVYIVRLKGQNGDTYNLDVKRISGTVSLGVTVLDPANIPIFTAFTGVTTQFSTQIKLANSGTYVLGLYRADIAPGAKPGDVAAYQLTLSKAP